MMPAEFLGLANFLPEPMLLIRADGQIAACNEACGALFSTCPDEIAGRCISEFLVEPLEAVVQPLQTSHDHAVWHPCELNWRLGGNRVDKRRFTIRELPAIPPSSPRTYLLRGEDEVSSPHCLPLVDAPADQLRSEDRATVYAPGYLAAMINSSLDAIIGRDLSGRITCWNTGAEHLFGYTAEEMLGNTLTALIPPDRQHEHDQILNNLQRGESVSQLETLRQAKDGRLIEVSISASPIKDDQGRIIGTSTIPRDITILKKHEREIERLSRLYAALSQINQAIALLPDRDKLLQRTCQILVEFGGLCMAWIGWIDSDTHQIVPVTRFGDEHDYVGSITVYVDNRPEGQGPSGIAFRTGRPYVCNDIHDDSSTLAWRPAFERCGFRASAALPIRMDGAVRGILAVYSDQLGFFQDREVALLEEAAMDVSFALDNFARQDAHRIAELAVIHERDFSNALLKSLPGILYLYDRNGKFLRWNQNFQDVTGYEANEIAAMHPVDFFSGPDKVLIDAKIHQVFQLGESNVEAVLVSKDGQTTPFYFTGVSTQIDGRECLIGIGIDISERRQAELLRRKSDDRYRALFAHAPDGIVILNHDGHYLDCNPSACQMLGYLHEELVGMHASQIVAPDEADRIQPAIDMIVNDKSYSGNWRLRRKDGLVLLAEVIATTLPDGILLALIRDVTERVRSEEQLREHAARLQESEAHLLQAQQIAKLGSWELNIQDNTLHWSNQIFDIFEIDKSHFANNFENFIERVHPDDRDALRQAQMAAINGEAQLNFEHRIVLPDGREKLVVEQADLKRDDTGRPFKLSGIVLDISDRKRMELERERRHRAEAADRIKSAFLATMSHELRTPLNSIIGFTGIILQGLAGPLNAEQRKQLEMVRGSARHLLALVNDVLDISKIEAGQLVVAQEPFNPRSSIEKVAALVAPLAEKKNLQFKVEVSPDLSYVVADERRFEQILWNLLSNAIKFTLSGSVIVSAVSETPENSPGAAEGRRMLRVSVSDTGIGIREEDLFSLFQPFRQVDTGLSRHQDGTGLGLAISRRLAELMGGDIYAESVWGQGSVFHVTLPLAGSVPE